MKTIILVDDEPLTLQYLKQEIAELTTDWKIIKTFCDGESAFDWLLRHSVDLILTDVKMPGMNGLELCEKITDINPEQNIVIISGYDEFEFAQEAINYGVKGYLLKPILPDKLKKLLDKVYHQLCKSQQSGIIDSSLKMNPVLENVLITKAIKYIQENYQKPISQTDIAQELNVSANYFSTVFRRETGTSYINYLTSYRLNKAVEIMKKYPRKKVYEISEEVGYFSPKHFIHLFKRETGISPGEYQRQIIESSNK